MEVKNINILDLFESKIYFTTPEEYLDAKKEKGKYHEFTCNGIPFVCGYYIGDKDFNDNILFTYTKNLLQFKKERPRRYMQRIIDLADPNGNVLVLIDYTDRKLNSKVKKEILNILNIKKIRPMDSLERKILISSSRLYKDKYLAVTGVSTADVRYYIDFYFLNEKIHSVCIQNALSGKKEMWVTDEKLWNRFRSMVLADGLRGCKE